MTLEQIIEYCLKKPCAYLDYPFNDTTGSGKWTVMRHRVNKKSFALIYMRGGKLCVNLKCNPFEADFLRRTFEDVTPAYHMNKLHWNTVMPGGDVPERQLKQMIEQSYELIKPKERRPK